jgi:eukaryotic-like serine/threonine-protein kinase
VTTNLPKSLARADFCAAIGIIVTASSRGVGMTAEQWIGRTIAGKYRVEAILGKGGMGLVLHARHMRLDDEVAIKVLLPSMLEVQGMVTRFVREARAASKIKSPHVVRVTDVDVLEDGSPYMVMEYLEGISLAALRRREGRLDVPRATRCVLQACDAIAEAHSLGIVHRDLKPANLFVAQSRDGGSIIKVLDFGISKVDAPGEQDTTKTGQMMGSPKYMAPEQMLSMHDVDGRSDIWSLGAILYDLLTGRTPFVADTVAQLCSKVLHDKPAPPRELRPDLPEALEAIILRCLERDRANRFPDVAALVAALTPFAPSSDDESQLRMSVSIRSLLPLGASEGPVTLSEKAHREAPTVKGVNLEVAPPPNLQADGSSERPPASVNLEGSAPPAHGATISGWHAPPAVPSRGKLRTRVAVASLALAAAGGLALALHQADPQSAPVAALQAPAALPPAPDRGGPAAAVPTASATADTVVAVTQTHPVGDADQAASSVGSTPAPLPRAPLKKVPRAPTADPAGAGSDPFGGKRK